uniref:DBAct553_1 n=1 Tax=synthetic construct TaxID=32630 RepID=UPI003753E80E
DYIRELRAALILLALKKQHAEDPDAQRVADELMKKLFDAAHRNDKDKVKKVVEEAKKVVSTYGSHHHHHH